MAKFGDYIEIENYINGGVQWISGIVIKDYGEGNCFIKVTRSTNLPKSSRRGWSKFSIKDDEGYYYSPSNIEAKEGHTKSAINETASSVIEYSTQINKTVNQKINGVCCSGTSTSKYLNTKIVVCPADNLTYVYLQDKDVGAWSKGISEESTKLAVYRALIKYYTSLERSIREPR